MESVGIFKLLLLFVDFDQLNSQPRLNFYVTIFLTAIIPWSKGRNTVRLWKELYKNAIFYGLALLITVLVQTIKGQLDLYHAIFVMHMLVFYSIHQFDGMSCVLMRIYGIHQMKIQASGLPGY